MKVFQKNLLIILVFSFLFYSSARADVSSPSFKVENPINTIGGGQSSSSSFQYISSTGELDIGQSSSISFLHNIGLLYFPIATSPVVSATAGDSQAIISWTASVGVLANITSYELGVSTTSGSGHVYTSVGDVLTTTKTGLTNGTHYYFKIRSYASGILLSESDEVSATPVASSNNNNNGGGGGGGGIFIVSSDASAVFSGRAYPSSNVTLLKDAQILSSTVAGSDANFTITVNNLNAGNYIFSVYSEDYQGNRSSLLTFPVSLTSGSTTNIGGIFLAPTLGVDKSQVKKGDNITFFGQSIPSSEITISIHSEEEIFKKVNADAQGVYLQVVDSSPLELGDHNAKSKSAKDGQISSYSKVVAFTVGNKNTEVDKTKKCPAKGDLNGDCRVNLVDFSIAAFWYKKNLNNASTSFDASKLNGDGKINLIDFSIMAYYWTG